MRQSTLLLLNTVVAYARMLLTVGFGLAATRLLMRRLGFDDFGIVSVMGATGMLLAVTSEALTSAAQRHMAYEVGRGDTARLTIIFNTSLAIFVIVGLAVFLVGSSISPVVLHGLQIPVGRERAAFWVYELTLLNLAATTIAIPFTALVDAHQAITISAIRDLTACVLQFMVVLLLHMLPGDALINYALWLLLVRIMLLVVFTLVVIRIFPASRPQFGRIRVAEAGHIAGYAGWASVGCLAWVMRMQGTMILLNVRFGTVVNSAYAIALQLAGYQGNLGTAVSVAARSATVQIHARGDGDNLRSMVLLASKYTCLPMLLFLVPVQLETPHLLNLWLKDYPAITPMFARLAMTNVALLSLGIGFQLAALARGNLARYTMLMGSFDVFVLVAGIVEFYVLHMQPTALLSTSVAVTAVQVCAQVCYVGKQIELPFRIWLLRVVRPALVVVMAGLIAAWFVHMAMVPGVRRLVLVTMACAAVALPTMWLFALEPFERHTIRQVLTTTYARLRARVVRG